jgi:hypothetical protein
MPSYQTMKSRLEKSEPEFEEDKGELPLKIDCKDNWKVATPCLPSLNSGMVGWFMRAKSGLGTPL